MPDGTRLQFNPFDALKMLGVLSGLGARTVALAAFSLLDEESFNALDASDRRYLTGPLVVGTAPGGNWEEGMPGWIKDQAHAERYRVVSGMMPRHLVAPCDIVAALYAPSLVAPLREFEASLYIWAGCHGIARWRRQTFEQTALMLHPDGTAPKDADFLSEKGRHAYDYRIFAADLRRRIEKHAPKGV